MKTNTTFSKSAFQQSFKSMDTEETLDIYINRPIGYLWALFFAKLHVHPNVVTILSIVLGISAGIMFYFPDTAHTLVGIGLLIWANHYDSADGQLARMTGKKTLWGRMLDGFAGDLWFISIYAAICLRFTHEPIPYFPDKEWGIYIWLLGALAGIICHTNQCLLADYYRNIHLYFLKGKSGSELDNFSQQRTLFYQLPWRGNFWWKLFVYFYGNYTRKQEFLTPAFQRFYQMVMQTYGQQLPIALQKDFLKGSRPLMKYTNILTFNTRAIVLYICLLIKQPYLYFLFETLVLSALFFYMHYQHERLCVRLYHQYKKR